MPCIYVHGCLGPALMFADASIHQSWAFGDLCPTLMFVDAFNTQMSMVLIWVISCIQAYVIYHFMMDAIYNLSLD